MLRDRLKAAGLRLTPQRMAIAKFLQGNTGHPSAEDIYCAAKRRFPTMSFATVYNTLEALKSVDAIRELKIDASRRRYDPNTVLHHHLICHSCGTIVDIHSEYLLDLPPEVANKFDVVGNHVEFIGICLPCKDRDAGKSEERPTA
jgi:Fur family peroxide stress response transcriptional regulator